MGASGWDYVQPFDTDLATTFAALRQRIFTEGHYFWFDSIARPATLADLDALCADDPMDMFDGEPDFDSPEFHTRIDIATAGTHSILDVHTVGRRADVEPLTAQETLELFGTCSPTTAIFEAADLHQMLPEKWGGFCVELHDSSGAVEAIAFWGCSGD